MSISHVGGQTKHTVIIMVKLTYIMVNLYKLFSALHFEEPSYTFSESKQGNNTPARICATILPHLPSITGSVNITIIPNTTQG